MVVIEAEENQIRTLSMGSMWALLVVMGPSVNQWILTHTDGSLIVSIWYMSIFVWVNQCLTPF